METRANYALIGAFTLAVIAAAFGFVPADAILDRPQVGRPGFDRCRSHCLVAQYGQPLNGPRRPLLLRPARVGPGEKMRFVDGLCTGCCSADAIGRDDVVRHTFRCPLIL